MIKRRPLDVKDISIVNDERFGFYTVLKITYLNDLNVMKNDFFFIIKELGMLLGLTAIKTSINSIPDQCKLLLKNEDIDKFKGTYNVPFDLDSFIIPNRGLSIINLSGLQRLIFKSRKKVAIDYQNWIFEEVLPVLWRNGGYYDPIKTDMNIRNLFGSTIYNYKETDPYFRSLNSSEYSQYKFVINNNYKTLLEDKYLQLRLYDMAFYLFFNIRLTDLIRDAKSVDNYMMVASDFGGPDAVDFMYHFIYGTVNLMNKNGIPIENIEYGVYNTNTSMALYRIPNGTKYTNYQISKLPPKVDFDKLHKEAWENAPKHGINPDEVVDK